MLVIMRLEWGTTIDFLYKKNNSSISDTLREYSIDRDNIIIFWSGCIRTEACANRQNSTIHLDLVI